MEFASYLPKLTVEMIMNKALVKQVIAERTN